MGKGNENENEDLQNELMQVLPCSLPLEKQDIPLVVRKMGLPQGHPQGGQKEYT